MRKRKKSVLLVAGGMRFALSARFGLVGILEPMETGEKACARVNPPAALYSRSSAAVRLCCYSWNSRVLTAKPAQD